QAEAGIRFLTVTGVQTCALPIYIRRAQSDEIFVRLRPPNISSSRLVVSTYAWCCGAHRSGFESICRRPRRLPRKTVTARMAMAKIGRASGRGRRESDVRGREREE